MTDRALVRCERPTDGRTVAAGFGPVELAHGAEDTGAQLLVIDSAGHCPFVDQPDRFFPAVPAFFHEL